MKTIVIESGKVRTGKKTVTATAENVTEALQNAAVEAAQTAPAQETPKKAIYEKRDLLKKLSIQVKPLVENGTYKNLNDAIICEIYKKDGHETFNTFEQWKNSGYSVEKGSKAFILWAKPVDKIGGEAGEQFYPVVFLFSNMQVVKVEPKKSKVN